MLPILILYVAKKFGFKIPESRKTEAFKKLCFKILVLIILTIVVKGNASAFTCTINTNEVKKLMVFNVLKNDKIIGTIEIEKHESENTITYHLNSEIKTNFILKFKIIGKETYVFKNGILEYSSLFRKVNDKVKVDQSLVYENGDYHLKKSDKDLALDLEAIQQNLITLYFQEPKNTKTVYCDNQSEMLDIQNIRDGVYKVNFSSNKYNIFYYENGKCVKIEAVSPIFNVTLIPS